MMMNGEHMRKYMRKPNRRNRQKMSRHHLKNKCRFGMPTPENLLNLWRDKHDAWHLLFKNASPEEIVEILQRMMSMKGYHAS